MAELQKYQWTMSGMRPDDSEMGAMWFYRGFDTDLELMRLRDELQAREELLESAWGLIANAYEGFWERASNEWFHAAGKWRDKWLHR